MRFLTLAVLVIIGLVGCTQQGAPPAPTTVAKRVIVVEATDVTASVTNVVNAPSAIAAIEALFPAYETRPSSDIAAGYEAQYIITFELPDGSSVRVVSDGEGELWSTGNGDFRVEGDLKGTLKSLK